MQQHCSCQANRHGCAQARAPLAPQLLLSITLQQPSSKVTALAHSIELGGCIVGTSDGGLLFLDAADESLQEVGQLDAGVVAMQWSPDGDTLLLATAAGARFWLHKMCLRVPFCSRLPAAFVLYQALKLAGCSVVRARRIHKCSGLCANVTGCMHVAGKLLMMSIQEGATSLLDVDAEVPLQQSVSPGGTAAVLSQADSFAPGSISISWRGDGVYVATLSKAEDEYAFFA